MQLRSVIDKQTDQQGHYVCQRDPEPIRKGRKIRKIETQRRVMSEVNKQFTNVFEKPTEPQSHYVFERDLYPIHKSRKSRKIETQQRVVSQVKVCG